MLTARRSISITWSCPPWRATSAPTPSCCWPVALVKNAISLAPAVLPGLARLNNQRDLVFIDQRGTGKSAPLQCPDDKNLPPKDVLTANARPSACARA